MSLANCQLVRSNRSNRSSRFNYVSSRFLDFAGKRIAFTLEGLLLDRGHGHGVAGFPLRTMLQVSRCALNRAC